MVSCASREKLGLIEFIRRRPKFNGTTEQARLGWLARARVLCVRGFVLAWIGVEFWGCLSYDSSAGV